MSQPVTDATPRTRDIKPGKGWYWLGGGLIAAGTIGAIALAVTGVVRYARTVEDFGRFAVPSPGALVSFDDSGEYRIYYESQSVIDGEEIDADDDDPPSSLSLVLTDAAGVEVPLSDADFDEEYDVDVYKGVAIYEVDVPEPGRYTLVASAAESVGPFAIAVGKGALESSAPWFGGSLGSFLLGLLTGVPILIVTAVRRSRAKRALETVPVGGYPAPAGAPQPVPSIVWAPQPAPVTPSAPGGWAPPVSPGGPLPPPSGPPAGEAGPGRPAPPPPSTGPWAPPAAPPR